MKQIWTICRKELRDTIRDRRTLISSIIMPMLLMPVLIVGMGKLVQFQAKQSEERTVAIAIVNETAAPEFAGIVRQTPKLEIKELSVEAETAVRERDLDAVLVLPPNFRERLGAEETVELVVIQNSLNDRSAVALSRIAVATARFNEIIFQSRLSERAVPLSIRNGLTVTTEETATEQELGGFGLGFILPLFIVMWAVVGGQYTAVDVSAGEKERKTLEALLLTPVRRTEIVAGKFLAVATAALVSVVIALGSLYAVFVFGGGDLFTSTSSTNEATANPTASQFDFSLDPAAVLTMFGISILLVCLFSAVNLAVAIFAKSYKEAQSYIGPSYLVVILPVVLFNSIPGFVPTTGFFAIPVVNAVLLFKEVLVGTYNFAHILLTIGSLAITAAIAMYVASRIYQKEGVLFRD